MQIQFLTSCNHIHRATGSRGLDERLKHKLAGPRLIQMRPFMRVFFAIIMLLDRTPSASVTFSSHMSIKFSGDRAFMRSAFHRRRHARSRADFPINAAAWSVEKRAHREQDRIHLHVEKM